MLTHCPRKDAILKYDLWVESLTPHLYATEAMCSSKNLRKGHVTIELGAKQLLLPMQPWQVRSQSARVVQKSFTYSSMIRKLSLHKISKINGRYRKADRLAAWLLRGRMNYSRWWIAYIFVSCMVSKAAVPNEYYKKYHINHTVFSY